MLVVALAVALAVVGCTSRVVRLPPPLRSPYPERRIVAVAPLRNESGSLAADGVRLADHLTRALEEVLGLDTLPVNRVLATMDALDLPEVATPDDALRLQQALGADLLVAGNVTAYDPYDPPTLGLTLELFGGGGPTGGDEAFDVRALTGAATDAGPATPAVQEATPLSRVSAVLDASDGRVRAAIKKYAATRGADDPSGGRGGPWSSVPAFKGAQDDGDWHRYRISMDLYSEFAGHEMIGRLIRAETIRFAIEGPDGPPPPP